MDPEKASANTLAVNKDKEKDKATNPSTKIHHDLESATPTIVESSNAHNQIVCSKESLPVSTP